MSKQIYEQIGVAMTCRSYEEYVAMFDLQEADLARGIILDVAAGGSSFTAEANDRGYDARAIDPRYGLEVEEWVPQAAEEIISSTAKLDSLKERFDWSYYGSLANHMLGRQESLKRFSNHVSTSMKAGTNTYIDGSLPELPFQDNEFSLVLCSHFMFLYANQFGYDFHVNSILELMRICKPGGKILIYPLISLSWEPYPQLEELMETIKANGGVPQLSASKLPFIPGSDHFLQISL